jgi:MoaA/NifB/PqqE/SkfB family radical SAM enzyme
LNKYFHYSLIGAGGFFGRKKALAGPWKVVIGVTDRCNYRCVMCREHSFLAPREIQTGQVNAGSEKYAFYEMAKMDVDLYRHLIDDLKLLGTRDINISGKGEPLLHDSIHEMIEYASEQGFSVGLTTNGSLMNRETAVFFIGTGVQSIHFSINAGTGSTYQKITGVKSPQSFEKVKNNLKTLLQLKREKGKANPKIMLSFVISSENFFEIPSMINLAVETEADRASFVVASIYYKETSFLGITDEDKKVLLQGLRDGGKIADQHGLIHNLDELGQQLNIKNNDFMIEVYNSIPCYVGWYFALVFANGTVLPCCQCLKNMGNLHKLSFKEIWNSATYREFRWKTKNLPASDELLQGCQCSECSHVGYNLAFHKLLHPYKRMNFGNGEVFTLKDLKHFMLKW